MHVAETELIRKKRFFANRLKKKEKKTAEAYDTSSHVQIVIVCKGRLSLYSNH